MDQHACRGGQLDARADDECEERPESHEESLRNVAPVVEQFAQHGARERAEDAPHGRREEEAAEEARFVVERLRGTNVSGPIAYDLEFYTADEARTDDLTGEQATQNALAFCDVIRQAGYEPVVYMNLHWAGSMYGMEELAHLPVWLASYGPVPALDRGVTLWQYSESGVVDGIEGPVDLDLWFTKE